MTGPKPQQPPPAEPSLAEYATVELPLVEPAIPQQSTGEQPVGEQPGGARSIAEPQVAQPVIPAQRTPAEAEETPIAIIGDITVTPTTVRTPHGEFALRGSTWQVDEEWTPYRQLPVWALLVGLLGLFVVGPFSVLFLMLRQTIYRGTALVTVHSWTRQHVTRVPLDDLAASGRLQQHLTYLRSLASF